MKRLLAVFLTFTLLPIALLFPMPASAAFNMPEDMYEIPEMPSFDTAWVIYDGENKSRALSCSREGERVELYEGYAFASHAPGNGSLTMFTAPYLAKDPLCIEDYDYSELALLLQFYVSDPTMFTSNCELELTSSGTYDKFELNFSPDKHFSLKTGWNTVYLPFSEGGIKNGQLDVTNINYLRFYFHLNGNVDMAFANIMIVPAVTLDVKDDFSATSSVNKWTASGATLTADSGAMKITGEGSISVTSSAYDLPIFQSARTPIDFKLKVNDPTMLTSLSFELIDENRNIAKTTLDIADLQSNAYVSYQVLCKNLRCEEGYQFELTKAITLTAQTSGAVTLYLDDLMIKAYDTEYWMDWYTGYTAEPGEYSIAVIPDIQELSAKYPHKLNVITQWIADNREKENILFAIDLGDVTWNGHTGDNEGARAEFANARYAFDILTEAGIDYSIAYGNHDYTPNGGKRDTTLYNEYFPLSLFQSFDSYGGTRNENNSNNTYFTFKGGSQNYLVLAIEYSPDNATIQWADEIVTAHPDHQVIVTTHGYLQGDSAKTVAEENALAPAVGADRLWNNLLKKHENIIMLICGHAWSQRYSGDLVMRQDKGEHGNTVYQIMANAQDIDGSRGGVGMLLMLRFSEDGNVIDFNWFSPVSGEAFRPNNQFKLAIKNEFSVSGIEDGATYCSEHSFTVNTKTTLTVSLDSSVLTPVDGTYTLPAAGRSQRITLSDPFGKKLATYRVIVNDGHTGGEASCAAAALCDACGESYGDSLSHEYGEDGLCTLCGASAPVQDDEQPDGFFSPVFLIPIAAAVVIACVAIPIALKKKKTVS